MTSNNANTSESADAALRRSDGEVAPPGSGPRSKATLRSLVLLPLALFVSIAMISVLRWRQEHYDQVRDIHQQTRAAQEHLARRIEEAIEEHVKPLRQLRRAWLLGNLQTQGDLASAAAPIWQDRPAYRMVGWVSSDNIVRFLSPVAGNESLLGRDLLSLAHWKEVMSRVRPRKIESVGPLYDHPQFGWVASFVVPILINDGVNDEDYRGSIIGQVDLGSTFSLLVDASTLRDFHVTICDGPRVVYDTRGQPSLPPGSGGPVRMLDRQLQLSLVPTASFIAAHTTSEPRWMLWGGLGGALLVSLAVFQALHHRLREQQRSQAHLDALESLNQISAAITAQSGNGRDVLDRLTQSACNLMRADRSALLTLDDDGSMVRVISALGDEHPSTYKLNELPITRQCIETGQIVVVENVFPDQGDPSFNAAHRRPLDGYRAVLAVPLLVEEKPIGVLVMAHAMPRRFSEAEVNLARVWGSHAAVTLVNIRLNERMEQALREQKKLAQYSQALADVNAEIYRAGSVEESMWTIANLAPPALDVNLCIAELVMGKDEVLVAASTGTCASTIVGRHIRLVGNVEHVLRLRQTLVVEDALNDPRVYPEFRKVMEIGSVIYVPMFRSDESPLGVLIFVRHLPGKFSPEQITLAEVFSRRAAVALENAWLNENARRDAETKAMLLRELNHRVKNNLAGIVGLLTTGEPELAPEARQWLNRVIERIGTISRAHELFSGGMERVGLSELVEQILPSVVVLKPPGVVVRTDLDPAMAITLRVERAVSVAMVLHELCTNAILHGLDATGTVTVRTRNLAGGRLAIDVIDDGRGVGAEAPCPSRNDGDGNGRGSPVAAVATASATRTGIGLTLVDGLVKRELNGRFSLICPPEGGTVATVEFPLLPDELQEVLK